MIWWFGASAIAIILYAVLSAWEAYCCPILSTREKLQLIFLSLFIPIFGAYFSNKKLTHKLSEANRSDLQLELPFWVIMGFPSRLKIKDSDFDADVD